MGRPHTLDQDPERIDILANMVADGATQQMICDAFGISDRNTVAAWKKRPDVQAKVTALIRQRSNDILARTDTAIKARLDEAASEGGKPVPLPDLLQIRRTYAGEKLTIDTAGDSARATEELMAMLADDPEKAQKFIDSTATEVEPDALPD